MIGELSNEYVGYVKVDVTKELTPVGETVEDMLMRLEEFESLVNMVQTNGSQCLGSSVPEVLARKNELRSLCDRIDSLESFVGRVRHDLDIVEAQMDAAEADVGISEGKLKNILKPLFFKKADPVVARNMRSPTYEPPEIFHTSNFFPPEDHVKKD